MAPAFLWEEKVLQKIPGENLKCQKMFVSVSSVCAVHRLSEREGEKGQEKITKYFLFSFAVLNKKTETTEKSFHLPFKA